MTAASRQRCDKKRQTASKEQELLSVGGAKIVCSNDVKPVFQSTRLVLLF